MLRMSSYVVLFALATAGRTPTLATAADVIVAPAQAARGNTFDVTAYGAVGDGILGFSDRFSAGPVIGPDDIQVPFPAEVEPFSLEDRIGHESFLPLGPVIGIL